MRLLTLNGFYLCTILAGDDFHAQRGWCDAHPLYFAVGLAGDEGLEQEEQGADAIAGLHQQHEFDIFAERPG